MGHDIFLLLGGVGAIALFYGGLKLIRRPDEAGKGRLMIIAALVLITNLLIVGWPTR